MLDDLFSHTLSGTNINIAAALSSAITTNCDLLDAELLLAQILMVGRSHLRAYPEQLLTTAQIELFARLIQRRLQGEPVAYLLGYKEFWSLQLRVTPATLVPRPETEQLVELLLGCFAKRVDEQVRVADLGTGSGAIALAIAHERPVWDVVATDKSQEALAVARENAERLGISTVHFYEGDWCAALPAGDFDAIISNPPYIGDHDPCVEEDGLVYEPRSALVSGIDGLDAIRQIIQEAYVKLRVGGWLLLEHGFAQGPAILALLMQANYRDGMDYIDLAGHGRMTVARKGL